MSPHAPNTGISKADTESNLDIPDISIKELLGTIEDTFPSVVVLYPKKFEEGKTYELFTSVNQKAKFSYGINEVLAIIEMLKSEDIVPYFDLKNSYHSNFKILLPRSSKEARLIDYCADTYTAKVVLIAEVNSLNTSAYSSCEPVTTEELESYLMTNYDMFHQHNKSRLHFLNLKEEHEHAKQLSEYMLNEIDYIAKNFALSIMQDIFDEQLKEAGKRANTLVRNNKNLREQESYTTDTEDIYVSAVHHYINQLQPALLLNKVDSLDKPSFLQVN